jgi:hypothetical protein
VLEEAERVAQKIPEPDLKREALGKIRGLMGTLPQSHKATRGDQ